MGYTETSLQEHVTSEHAETSTEVVCSNQIKFRDMEWYAQGMQAFKPDRRPPTADLCSHGHYQCVLRIPKIQNSRFARYVQRYLEAILIMSQMTSQLI
ncbi:hypothetical protein STEG23_027262 [Scotinomys teguina]